VQVCQLLEDLKLDNSVVVTTIVELPPKIRPILSIYSDIFATKVSYSPSMACYHSIPLIPGATLVHLRPYRYPPALKNEIETKV
jgi:hypothetical protein